MINLAGVADCDETIERELRRARLEPVWGELSRGEVATRVRAELGPLRFTRAWRYWVVRGPVPLAVAHQLYADPIGRTDIRVDGHCACPAPEWPWVTYEDVDGYKLRPLSGPDAPAAREAFPSALMRGLYEQIDREWRFVDEPAAVAARAYVDQYHVDSMEGLRVLVDALRAHGIGARVSLEQWHRAQRAPKGEHR